MPPQIRKVISTGKEARSQESTAQHFVKPAICLGIRFFLRTLSERIAATNIQELGDVVQFGLTDRRRVGAVGRELARQAVGPEKRIAMVCSLPRFQGA